MKSMYEQASCCPQEQAHVQLVKEKMIAQPYLNKTSAFFKLLGDESRIKILYALSLQELCVNEISEALKLSQSAVSHQLKLLRDGGLVRARRDGKNVYYNLDDEHVTSILGRALEHIQHIHTNEQL